ncbi:MAG: SDR family NAD(P)-dependent oxidoreductase [Nostoc sp.]
MNARSLETLESVVVAVTSLGGKAAPLQLDITDEAAVEKVFIEIKDKYGRLDTLVNNVGMRDRRQLFEFDLCQ